VNRRASHRIGYEIVSDYTLTAQEIGECENEQCSEKSVREIGISEEGRYPQFPTRLRLCNHCADHNLWPIFFQGLDNLRSELEELKNDLKFEDQRRPF
jgi:hypothetical protein